MLTKLIKLVINKTNLKKNELKEVVLFGQNPKFDISFLESAFKNIGGEFPFDYHTVDLVSIYFLYYMKKFHKLPEKVTLKDICKHFGANMLQAHDAMNDITMTIAMFRLILGNMDAKITELHTSSPT